MRRLVIALATLHGSRAEAGWDGAGCFTPWLACDNAADELSQIFVPRVFAQSPDAYGQPAPLAALNDPPLVNTSSLVNNAPLVDDPTVLSEQTASSDDASSEGLAVKFMTSLYDDARMFYSVESLTALSAAVGIAALMANTKSSILPCRTA